jgi:citrate synthase
MAEATGKSPNIDFALVSIRRAFDLPPGAALALFAVGRTVGWIAHALEQRADDKLIRPRASYVGPPPQDGPAAAS